MNPGRQSGKSRGLLQLTNLKVAGSAGVVLEPAPHRRESGYRVSESLPEWIPFNQQVYHVLSDARPKPIVGLRFRKPLEPDTRDLPRRVGRTYNWSRYSSNATLTS